MISNILRLLEREYPDIRHHSLSLTDMLLLHIASQSLKAINDDNKNQDNNNNIPSINWKSGLINSVNTNDWYAVLENNPNRWEWLFSNVSSSNFILGYEGEGEQNQPEGFIVVAPGVSVGRNKSIVRFTGKDYGYLYCRATTGTGEREFLCSESSL